MGMGDCLKCWNRVCTCGWDYRIQPISVLEEHIHILSKVIKFKREHPDAEFSDYIGPDTKDDKLFELFMRS